MIQLAVRRGRARWIVEQPDGIDDDVVAFRGVANPVEQGRAAQAAPGAYGSSMAREVRYLRAFRDEYLLTNKPGRWFVEQYYRLSPPLADELRAHDDWRAIVRFALSPLVALSKRLVSGDTFENQTVDRP